MRRLLPLLCLLFLPPAGAQEQGTTDLRKEIRLKERDGAFEWKVRDVLSNAKVKSFAIVADWWNGGEDDRVGDPEKAEKGSFVLQVRHGRKWHTLPPAKRNRRLIAHVPAPKGLFSGLQAAGIWIVRQKEGAEPLRRVRIKLVYSVPWGKGLQVPDLRIDRIVFDEVESHPPAEGTYPERRDFPKLMAGKKYKAKVHLANPGYGDAHEPEIALFLTNLDGKKKKSLPPLKVEIYIREGEDLQVSWTLPLSAKLKPGLYRLHAVVDPTARIRELDETNNAWSRIIRVIAK